MRWSAANPWIAWFRGIATLFATLTLVALAYFKAADGFDPQAYPALKWIAERKGGIVLVLLLTQSISQLLAWFLGKFERQDLKQIHKALDQIAGKHFPGVDLDRHAVRATLFKKRGFWLLGCWLGAVDRSGEKYRGMTSIFSVNDNIENIEAENTGVAGGCHWTGRTICLGVDPVGQTGDPTDYKSRTYLTDEEYDGLNLKSVVFLAPCIKVDGRKWGVLVLDTTDPNAEPKPNSKDKERRLADLEHATELLATLLR